MAARAAASGSSSVGVAVRATFRQVRLGGDKATARERAYEGFIAAADRYTYITSHVGRFAPHDELDEAGRFAMRLYPRVRLFVRDFVRHPRFYARRLRLKA